MATWTEAAPPWTHSAGNAHRAPAADLPVSGSLYFAALLGALVICVAGGLMAHRPRRRCLQCNERILQSARRCPHCGYEIER
ncbi:MAG TPA: hypothetical protein VE449_04740 [Thermoleophilaceae bacterium]|nr:hypothetical protein [Thermoleophilaceae bacterium]